MMAATPSFSVMFVSLLVLVLMPDTGVLAIKSTSKLPLDYLCGSKCRAAGGDPERMLGCCFLQLAAYAEALLLTCGDPASAYQLGEDFDSGAVDPDLVHRMMSYTHLLPHRLPTASHPDRKRMVSSAKRYGGNYDYGMALPWQMPNGASVGDSDGDKKVFRYGK